MTHTAGTTAGLVPRYGSGHGRAIGSRVTRGNLDSRQTFGQSRHGKMSELITNRMNLALCKITPEEPNKLGKFKFFPSLCHRCQHTWRALGELMRLLCLRMSHPRGRAAWLHLKESLEKSRSLQQSWSLM